MSSSSTHLLVLVHGMWGNPSHLSELARVARETYPEPTNGVDLHILQAETVRDDSTYDGVDWGGEKVAKEVTAAVKDLEEKGKKVTRFSITGYSLGGLIARYCVGVLHQRGFFDNIEPINFNTIATPNCGLPRYNSFLSSITSTLGPKLLSRTGEQFFCVDKWSPKGRPLLVVLADPTRIFYQALSKFQHIRIYANTVNDRTVPYVTAAIEIEDPFAEGELNGIKIDLQEKYPFVISEFMVPEQPPPRPMKPTLLSPAWFKGLKKPLLPPVLNFRFPFNLILYLSLPILIPIFATLAVTRFMIASKGSRRRIKLMEKEAHLSGQKRLAHILEELERDLEEAVVDLIDDPNPSALYQAKPSTSAHPIITPTHQKIASWLNSLPIKKELAYFPHVMNSHAVIIVRDPKRFDSHKDGLGVVAHWANSLIL